MLNAYSLVFTVFVSFLFHSEIKAEKLYGKKPGPYSIVTAEALGTGYYYSLNYGRKILDIGDNWLMGSIGAGYTPIKPSWMAFPLELYTILGGDKSKHQYTAGVGVSVFKVKFSGRTVFSGFPTVNLGYRYKVYPNMYIAPRFVMFPLGGTTVSRYWGGLGFQVHF